MLGRSKPQGNYMQDQWRNLADTVRRFETPTGSNSPLSEQIETFADESHAHLVTQTIESATPILLSMGLNIVTTNAPLGFITSDAPAVMYNPKAHTFPPHYRAPGLLQRDIEVSLPLTPRLLAYFSHKPPLRQFYVELSESETDEMNRGTFFHCGEEFVSWKGTTKEAWFEERQMPEDAWELTESSRIELGADTAEDIAGSEREHKKWWNRAFLSPTL
jgi:hypothetical protein